MSNYEQGWGLMNMSKDDWEWIMMYKDEYK